MSDIDRTFVWSDTARQNPHAAYRLLREKEPCFRGAGPVTGNTFWFMMRYEDCVSVLKDTRFIKDYRKTLSKEDLDAQANAPTAILNQHMLQRDPPEHTRLRSLVQKAFTPRMMTELKPRVIEIAEDLIASLRAANGPVDLIEEFAFPLPITVIAELLGIPAEQRDTFRRWTKTILFEADEAKRGPVFFEFVGFCNQTIEDRRATPREDLISALVTASDGDDALSHQEILAMIFLLLAAGHETTVNLIGNGIYTLLHHPEQLALLREDSSLTPNAVEEILRFESPVENTLTRWASEEIEWGDVTIGKHDPVLATLLSANRDPNIFTDPDRFDITRENAGKHIAFAQGIHYCLGAPLARIEGEVAFAMLLDAFDDIQLAGAAPWNDDIIFHGLTALPVHLG